MSKYSVSPFIYIYIYIYIYISYFSINPRTLLHTPPLSDNFTFLWALRIGPNTLHSSYLPSTLYPFQQERINHTALTQNIWLLKEPSQTPNYYPYLQNTPSISLSISFINFLKLIKITLCSSVIIIIVHKNTKYYCNPIHYFDYARTIKDDYSIHNISATFHQFIIIS